MRTAISYLDKVSSFTDEITVENVVKALGISDYDNLNDLLKLLLSNSVKESINVVEDIYSQGKDLKLFIKQFIQFILDVEKYLLFKSYDYIQIPNTIDLSIYNESTQYLNILNILDDMIKLSNDIKYEQNPRVLIESSILVMGGGGVKIET